MLAQLGRLPALGLGPRLQIGVAEELGLDRPDVVPIFLGDDVTDEYAFSAIADRGIGIFVGRATDPEVGGRPTSATFVLASPGEVQAFLDSFAR